MGLNSESPEGHMEMTTGARESESLLLTVEEAASLLRIGRNTCYELVRQGRVPSVRLGRLIRVPRHALVNWLGQEASSCIAPAVVKFPSSQRH